MAIVLIHIVKMKPGTQVTAKSSLNEKYIHLIITLLSLSSSDNSINISHDCISAANAYMITYLLSGVLQQK